MSMKKTTTGSQQKAKHSILLRLLWNIFKKDIMISGNTNDNDEAVCV